MSLQQTLIKVSAGILGCTILTTGIVRAGGQTPSTHNAEWAAATKEYLRFQQMNPIGLGGRKPFTPNYLEKSE